MDRRLMTDFTQLFITLATIKNDMHEQGIDDLNGKMALNEAIDSAIAAAQMLGYADNDKNENHQSRTIGLQKGDFGGGEAYRFAWFGPGFTRKKSAIDKKIAFIKGETEKLSKNQPKSNEKPKTTSKAPVNVNTLEEVSFDTTAVKAAPTQPYKEEPGPKAEEKSEKSINITEDRQETGIPANKQENADIAESNNQKENPTIPGGTPAIKVELDESLYKISESQKEAAAAQTETTEEKYTNVAITAPDGSTTKEARYEEEKAKEAIVETPIHNFNEDEYNENEELKYGLYRLVFEHKAGEDDTSDMPTYKLQVIPLKDNAGTNTVYVLLRNDRPVSLCSKKQEEDGASLSIPLKDKYIFNGLNLRPGNHLLENNSMLITDVANEYKITMIEEARFNGWNRNLEKYIVYKDGRNGCFHFIYAFPAGNIAKKDDENPNFILGFTGAKPLIVRLYKSGLNFTIANVKAGKIYSSYKNGEFSAKLVDLD